MIQYFGIILIFFDNLLVSRGTSKNYLWFLRLRCFIAEQDLRHFRSSKREIDMVACKCLLSFIFTDWVSNTIAFLFRRLRNIVPYYYYYFTFPLNRALHYQEALSCLKRVATTLISYYYKIYFIILVLLIINNF